jgi:hypothetical protein
MVDLHFEIHDIMFLWCERRDKKLETAAKENEPANFFVCILFQFLEQQTQCIIRLQLHFCSVTCVESMSGGFLVTMEWRVLRLRVEETASTDMEGSCEYIE